MTRTEFSAWCASGVHFLDGATGSNLMKAGMPKNCCAEAWVLEHPQPLMELQRAYAEAGSQIVYVPSFSANPISLKKHGLAEKTAEMNRALVAVSREAVGSGVLVAGDMTTTGLPVDPYGDLEYDELKQAYRVQAQALFEGGADLIVVETMIGLLECQAAVEAIREVCELPVMVSMTLSPEGRCFLDGSAAEAAKTLPGLGADALGVNCSSGPQTLENVVKIFRDNCGLPVIAKPNAGFPQVQEDGTAVYTMQPEEFAAHMRTLVDAGAKLIGGCCGTTPAHIAAIHKLFG